MKSFNRPITWALAALMASLGLTALPVAAEEDVVIEEMVVTGSRIVRPNLVQPTPVTTVTSEDLRVSGTSDLGSLLSQFPALGQTGTVLANADQFEAGIDDGGLSTLDLRRLGTQRTLTLVNGKRHVSGSAGNTAVDVGTIPISLVERVEVLTGGASAIYGSDAVSGVVNIIMKDDFEGVEFELQTAESTEGRYAGEYQIAFTLGSNFADDRGNFTFSYQRASRDQTKETELPYADDVSTIVNPDDTGPSDGIPDRLLVPRVYSELADENGVVFTPPTSFSSAGPTAVGLWATTFDEQGNPIPQTLRENSNSLFFGNFPDGCDYCLKLSDYNDVIPEIEQNAFNVTAHYDLTEWATFYVEGKYVESDTFFRAQPSFVVFEPIDFAANPFADPELAAELVNVWGPIFGDAVWPIIKFFDEDGGRDANVGRQTTRIVAGFEGAFQTGAGEISYDLFYNYGETKNDIDSFNVSIDNNLFTALDVITGPDGNPACRNPENAATPGPCVPYNPFGRQNTQEARDYSFTTTNLKQGLVQESAGLSVVSDTGTWFNLPGGAIGWAAGIEWRREESSSKLDPFVKSGQTEFAPQPDEIGGYEVFEYFAELTMPILSDRRFARELTLDGAFRIADYTHAGNAEAWKVGLMYAPFDDVRFRGTYSEAVRAPNITEAFLPATPGFDNTSDPCDADDLQEDPDRAANCAALGMPPGFVASDNVSIDVISGGNKDLDPEDSESFTVGLIYEPRFVDGLSFTIDYYDIEITDAITFVDPQDTLDNCVDKSGGPDENFCSLITRGADFNVELVRSTAVNASSISTKGIDYQINYNKSLSDWTDGGSISWLSGNLAINVTGNYLKELDVFIFQDRPDEIDIERGEIGDPVQQWRGSMSYQHNNWRIGWVARYIGNMKRYDRSDQTCEALDPCETGSTMYHDLNFQYLFNVASMEMEVYGGVNNVANEEPPQDIAPATANSAIFNIGRTWFFGVRGRL